MAAILVPTLVDATVKGLIAVRCLRFVRAAQGLRAVKRVPQMAMVMQTIAMSVQQASHIVLLTLMVMYVFAVVGVSALGENDPFHFGSIGVAMVTLFRVATLDGWPEILYFNMYGCDGWGHYSDVMVRTPGRAYDGSQVDQETIEPSSLQPTVDCIHQPQPLFSVCYFVVFISFCSYLMLNLFIATIVSTMEHVVQIADKDKALKREWSANLSQRFDPGDRNEVEFGNPVASFESVGSSVAD